MPKPKQSNKGCRGRRLKIEVYKSDSLLQDERSLIQKGTVIGAGPEAVCKVGDVIVFNAFGLDKVTIDDKDVYYIIDTDEFLLEIVPKQ